MYSRNYTEILMMLHTMDTQKLRNKTELYLDPLNTTTRNYKTIACTDGWIYNRTMFPNTVVMEVSIAIAVKIHFLSIHFHRKISNECIFRFYFVSVGFSMW